MYDLGFVLIYTPRYYKSDIFVSKGEIPNSFYLTKLDP